MFYHADVGLPRKTAHRFLAALGTLALGACSTAQDPQFRARSDFGAPLNADTGWAGPVGERVSVTADRPFRLRLETEPAASSASYALEVSRNAAPWEPVEAHDFPYPTREHEVSFEGVEDGASPPQWDIRSGESEDLAVRSAQPAVVLRAAGGEGGLVALYRAPWPLPEFAFAADFRIPAGNREGFSMIFGYLDAENHYRATFAPGGPIRVLWVAGGRETELSRQAAPIAAGTWHRAEIKREGGVLEVNFDDDALEFEVPLPSAVPESDPGIAVPPGGSVDLGQLVVEGQPRAPRASIVATDAYADGDPTQDLLRGSSAPFAPGAGVSLAERTSVGGAAGRHGEFEWPLVIRLHADGPVMNRAGDVFAFRMVDDRGAAAGPVARVELAVPPGHLGGTFVETPGRVGPFQAANGDLYFIMEPTESDNRFMMMKSTDGGASWAEVDGAHRPATGDLESVDARQVGDTIHIVHQVTETVRYHVFRTSDHAGEPDSWAVTDEIAATDEAHSQMATLAVRSDGSIVTVFLGDRLHYAVRSPSGAWSPPVELDPEVPERTAGPQAIVGRGDVVHLAYYADDGTIWHRRLLPDGTLTERALVASGAGTSEEEFGAVLPLGYDARADVVHLAYRLEDGSLWERGIAGDGSLNEATRITAGPVITNAVDAQQPAADIVLDGENLHVLFIDEPTRSIFATTKVGGVWQPAVKLIDGIEGSWVRGNIIRNGAGQPVYGFVYDAGSRGGAGFNRYAEISPGS